jgi:hypothetical protein
MDNTSQLQVESSWHETTQLLPDAAALEKLFAGEVASLCVPSFLTPEECQILKQRAEDLEFKDYLNVTPRIERVGITVFEYFGIGKKEYFEAVTGANRSISKITDGICNPLQRVIGWLRALAPESLVSIAHEEGYSDYFAGILRRIEEGTLVHVDFAPLEQPKWGVARIRNQLAFNIYLDVPENDPGVVDIWQKRWTPQDEKYKIAGSYGFVENVVAGISRARIVPKIGMMMMINTQNYHQVSPAGGMRLAFSAAIGRMPDNNIILWS